MPYFMRSALLMDMENVDPQTVPFFKRSVAKMTWEFSVPLVHTPCVLQMFVPVVSVGKDFFTPPTFITLHRFYKERRKNHPQELKTT